MPSCLHQFEMCEHAAVRVVTRVRSDDCAKNRRQVEANFDWINARSFLFSTSESEARHATLFCLGFGVSLCFSTGAFFTTRLLPLVEYRAKEFTFPFFGCFDIIAVVQNVRFSVSLA